MKIYILKKTVVYVVLRTLFLNEMLIHQINNHQIFLINCSNFKILYTINKYKLLRYNINITTIKT